MVHICGGRVLKLPLWLLYPLTDLAWLLRLRFLTEFPSPALNCAIWSWVIANKKVKRDLNYKFKYTTREAFEDFAKNM
jgi:hypothetical protein